MNQQSKYLTFLEQQSKPKTRVFYVINKMSRDLLGKIKWYGPFRKYAYFTEPDIVYDKACLADLSNFIEELNQEQKAKAKL